MRSNNNKMSTYHGIIIIIGVISGMALTVAGEIVLEDDQVHVVINEQTGLIDNFVSLNPTPLEISGKDEGLCFLVFDSAHNTTTTFKKLVSLKSTPDGVVARLTCDEVRLAETLQVVITYTLVEDGGLRVQCLVKWLKDMDRPMELLFGQPKLQADDWQNQVFPAAMGNMDVLSEEYRKLADQQVSSSSAVSFQRFSDHPSDVTRIPEGASLKTIRYPYGVLEGKDRYLLYGKMDVNGYVYLTPNYFGFNPCMMITPKAGQKGQSYLFELTYKFFEKTNYYFTDVCRWYAENVYSTNRLTMGIVRLPKNHKPRTFSVAGNGGGLPHYWLNKSDSEMPEKRKMYDAFARQAKIVHLWGGWTEWNEIPCTESSWIDWGGYRTTEQEVLDELGRRHEAGYREYAYRRQLFISQAYFPDKPWKQAWMLRTKPGTVFVCPSGPEPEYRLPYGDSSSPLLQDYLHKELGLPVSVKGKDSLVHADFCNDECRSFYVERLKAWIDKYPELDGIAFDMGWDIHTVPCLAHPDDGQHHGIVNVMAQMYQYVHQRYPHMRIWVNMTLGSPSNLWCDVVMFEGASGNVTYAAVEGVKIYRTTMLGWYYIFEYCDKFGDRWKETLKYRMRRNLSYGVCIALGGWLDLWLPYPELTEITDFYRVASELTALPLVIENDVLRIKGYETNTVIAPKISGSVFAGKNTTYVVVFNDTSEDAAVDVRVNKDRLKAYQPTTVAAPEKYFVFDRNCHLKKAGDFSTQDGEHSFAITGTLGAKELMVVTTQDFELTAFGEGLAPLCEYAERWHPFELSTNTNSYIIELQDN